MQVRDEEPGFFYGEWHQLFATTFLERNVFERYFSQMERLLPYLPSERYLVHGGFGYGNVLVHRNAVSAVLDWQDARYGDPLYDLAYMVFFRDAPVAAKILEAYRQQASKRRLPLEHFAARLACYQYYIGLDTMRFAAKTNNPGLYKYVLEKRKLVEV